MRPGVPLSRLAASSAATLLAGLLLVGCASTSGTTSTTSENGGSTNVGSINLFEKLLGAAPPEPPPPPVVVRESCGTPAQCKSALKKLVDNPKRSWVGQHEEPAAYTDGTRLFAYRALRTRLSCQELSAALTEVRGVSQSLAGEVPGVSHDQLSRTRALNSQVEGELAKERGRRCKGKA